MPSFTSGHKSNFNQFSLNDDSWKQEAEGGDQVDEGGCGSSMVPGIPDDS